MRPCARCVWRSTGSPTGPNPKRPEPDPANRVVRDSVADAINQIRARQTGAQSPAPAARTAELSGFADALNALGERIGRFEAEMASRFDRFANQPDIAAQVTQISEVIEMLAGAVSNNGEVQRINQSRYGRPAGLLSGRIHWPQ